MRPIAIVPLVLAALVLATPPAVAAAPANDAAAGAAPFTAYSAAGGPPGERGAVADLAEATADPGVAPCLGPGSFARTVWFRIGATGGAREITIEASGRTLALVDLAAYVQPAGSGAPDTRRANACGGPGVGGADLSEERTSALSLRVPPGRAVLVRVGRRGAPRDLEDEQAELTLAAVAIPPTAPAGDRAGRATPTLPRSGLGLVGLSGATTTEEDVATPRCTALATVWRRVRVRRPGRLTVAVEGAEAGTLAVFRGTRSVPATMLGCVDRDGPGPLTLPVTVRTPGPLWVRVGTDRPPTGARARLRVAPSRPGDRTSGGGCLGRPGASVSGSPTGPSTAAARNRSRFVAFALQVARGPICAARLTLEGPNGATYAAADVGALRGRGQVVALRRTRRLVPGRYRLRTEGAGYAAVRIRFRTTVAFGVN